MSGSLEIAEQRLLIQRADLPIDGEIAHSDVTVEIRGAIKSVDFVDNEDNTFDRIHKFVPKFVSVITENGDVIKSKDTRTHSKLLKGQIEQIRREKAPDYDEQAWYDRCMVAVRHNLVEILAAEGII